MTPLAAFSSLPGRCQFVLLRRCLVVVAVVTAVPACTSSSGRPKAPTSDGALEARTQEYTVGTGPIAPGGVLLYTAGDYAVTKPITLRAVRLADHSNVEGVQYRVLFARSSTRPTASMQAAFCVPWPVRSYGATAFPVEGLHLEPGEIIWINVFAQAGSPGPASAVGLRIDYESGGKHRRYVDRSSHVEMEVTESEPSHCLPATDSEFAVP